MGIWSRLERLVYSNINDLFGLDTSRPSAESSGDPDYDEAYEELDDFLNQRQPRSESKENFENARPEAKGKLPPEVLRADFECLQVPFGADAETCKASYKRLLKIHHPDRHAGHEGNFKKATERSARINASWDRIEKWRKDGNGI